MALIPSEDSITINGDGEPLIRISFEFDDEMPEEMREAFIMWAGTMVAGIF